MLGWLVRAHVFQLVACMNAGCTGICEAIRRHFLRVVSPWATARSVARADRGAQGGGGGGGARGGFRPGASARGAGEGAGGTAGGGASGRYAGWAAVRGQTRLPVSRFHRAAYALRVSPRKRWCARLRGCVRGGRRRPSRSTWPRPCAGWGRRTGSTTCRNSPCAA